MQIQEITEYIYFKTVFGACPFNLENGYLINII